MFTCHSKRISFTAHPHMDVICVAVMPDGSRVEVTTRAQLMCLRRVARGWEDKKGQALPFTTPADLLREAFGYHV